MNTANALAMLMKENDDFRECLELAKQDNKDLRQRLEQAEQSAKHAWERHAEKDRAYGCALNERDTAIVRAEAAEADAAAMREALWPFVHAVWSNQQSGASVADTLFSGVVKGAEIDKAIAARRTNAGRALLAELQAARARIKELEEKK